MFKCFIENGLISPNHPGFKPGDSCIDQLLSTTHDIYKPFDCNYEVRCVINGLPKGLSSNAKLFADNTLFSVIHYSSAMRNELNDNLAYQWKMSSYPDPNK